MTALLTPDELSEATVDEIGGKAAGLRALVAADAPVPPFVVLPAAVFRSALATSKVPELLGALQFAAADTPTSDLAALFERESERLRGAVTDLSIAAVVAVVAGIELRFDPGCRLAVRSSMVGEDSAGSSYAGQLWTGVGVAADDAAVAVAVRTCWASVFSPHALWYSYTAGLALTTIRLAVVIQQMIDADAAGVLFTADPRSGERDVSVISAALGLGEAVVGGLVDCDEYRVRGGREIESTAGGATEQVVASADGATSLVPIPADRRGHRVLSSTQTLDLADWGRRLAAGFGRPLDIEFGYAGDELYLLQARPITALPPPPAAVDEGSEEWLWDDSNIQESFCGVTLPLTFSFASKVYQLVYRSLGGLLGVGEMVDRDHADMVRTMIGLLDGRVYYNLNAWFEGLSLLPSSGNNKADMERMMGVEEPVPFVVDQTTNRLAKLSMMARLAPAAARLAPQYVRLASGIEAFDERLAALERSVDLDVVRTATVGDCLRLETRLWTEVLAKWQAPIINDFRVMQASGKLRRLVESLTTDAGRRARLEIELLAAIEGLASVEPTRAMMRMAAHLRDHEATASAFTTGEPTAALAAARELDPEFDSMVGRYLAAFGGRCMGELKLETVTLRRDPTFLVEVVRSYIPRVDLDPDHMTRDETIRYRAALEEFGELAGPSRRGRALRTVESARVAIAAREHLRLARTRVFDIVRELYLSIGTRFAEAGVLDAPRDIFYLTVDEVRGFHEGTTVTTDLRGLVGLRRAEFDAFETRRPAHRIATRGTVHFTATFESTLDDDTSRTDADGSITWSGLGCYPKVAEGEAIVVLEPSAASATAGKILVAVRTDPGWAPLFPTAAGLVVERGSSLSHSAVIAREIGLPTVVGVGGVTAVVPDGARLRVDGGAGLVTMLTGDRPNQPSETDTR